jgi:hypothetical protein
MAVVIQDFEVIAAPPPASQQPSAQASPPVRMPGPTPGDIARVIEHQKERAERVRAH